MIRWIPAAAIATLVLGPTVSAQGPLLQIQPPPRVPAGCIEPVLDASNTPLSCDGAVVGRTTRCEYDREADMLSELPYGLPSERASAATQSRGAPFTDYLESVLPNPLQLAGARTLSRRRGPVATLLEPVTQLAGLIELLSTSPAPPSRETPTRRAAWRLRHLPRPSLRRGPRTVTENSRVVFSRNRPRAARRLLIEFRCPGTQLDDGRVLRRPGEISRNTLRAALPTLVTTQLPVALGRFVSDDSVQSRVRDRPGSYNSIESTNHA